MVSSNNPKLSIMIPSIISKDPSISLNRLIRHIWKQDPDIKATSIVRNYFRYFNQKNKEPKKIIYIKLPESISHYNQIIIKDMQAKNVSLSFKNFRRYGISAKDIREIEKLNGLKRSG